MNRTLLRNLANCAGVALAVSLVCFIIMRYTDNTVEANENIQVCAIFEGNSCLVCHTSNVERPFYGSFPIIEKLVECDITMGIHSFNMDGMLKRIAENNKISEIELDKLENVISEGTMPLKKYSMIHWESHINNNEKEIILNWIKNVRKDNYTTSLSSDSKN